MAPETPPVSEAGSGAAIHYAGIFHKVPRAVKSSLSHKRGKRMTTFVASAITAAIQNRHCLRIRYAPGERLVEPHAFGRGADGQLLLRAYQTEGASASGEHEHWKLFRVDRILRIEATDTSSDAPRPGYKSGDKAMKGGIIAEL